MNYCYCCEYAETCELANTVNFCSNCKDCTECGIGTDWCKAGHDIECNNGFEAKNDEEVEE